MKEEFIHNIRNANMGALEPYLELEQVIQELPNCYAKGHLEAKFYAHHAEDIEEIQEDLILWAEHDIWK